MNSQIIENAAEAVKKSGQWVTLQEASHITGKSINAVRLLVKRNKFDHIKKVQGKGHGQWLIRKDSIDRMVKKGETTQGERSDQTTQPVMIPLEHYEAERDRLMQGLMMYRFKFEEAEKQLKLLPAPAEVVSSQLQEKDEALKAEVEYRNQLTSALHEKEARLIHLQAELEAEKKRSWWKKFLGVK